MTFTVIWHFLNGTITWDQMFQLSLLPSQLCLRVTIGACMHLENAQFSSLQKTEQNSSLVQVPHYCRPPETWQVVRAPLAVPLPEPSLPLPQGPPARGQARRTRVPCSHEQQKRHVEAQQVEGHPIGPTSLGGKRMGTGTGWADSHSTRCSWAPAAARETPAAPKR